MHLAELLTLRLIPERVASKTPKVKVAAAIATAEKTLNGKFDKESFPAPSIEYLAKPDGSAALTYAVQVRNDDEGTWYEAFVDAHSGELVSVTDFRAHATVSFVYATSSIAAV